MKKLSNTGADELNKTVAYKKSVKCLFKQNTRYFLEKL